MTEGGAGSGRARKVCLVGVSGAELGAALGEIPATSAGMTELLCGAAEMEVNVNTS